MVDKPDGMEAEPIRQLDAVLNHSEWHADLGQEEAELDAAHRAVHLWPRAPGALPPKASPAIMFDFLHAGLEAADERLLFARFVRHPAAVRAFPVELQLLTFRTQLGHRQGDLAPVPLAGVAVHDGETPQPGLAHIDLAMALQPRLERAPNVDCGEIRHLFLARFSHYARSPTISLCYMIGH